jgi:hypothetical protein
MTHEPDTKLSGLGYKRVNLFMTRLFCALVGQFVDNLPHLLIIIIIKKKPKPKCLTLLHTFNKCHYHATASQVLLPSFLSHFPLSFSLIFHFLSPSFLTAASYPHAAPFFLPLTPRLSVSDSQLAILPTLTSSANILNLSLNLSLILVLCLLQIRFCIGIGKT